MINYRYNPAYQHPILQKYLPPELEGRTFLLAEGSTEDQIYDEEALEEWEAEELKKRVEEDREGSRLEGF